MGSFESLSRWLGSLSFCHAKLNEDEVRQAIQLTYLRYLGRAAEPEHLDYWTRSLVRGASFSKFLLSISQSEEAKLATGAVRRSDLHAGAVPIMGTDRILTKTTWSDRLASAGRDGEPLPTRATHRLAPFSHSGTYDVTAIASMYRAGRYIERFLEDMTSQTIFDRSELIIIDADSPDDESAVIRRYMERFPNIVYRRINFRIGIYDAWNLGISMARGAYLTNANMDDLRHEQSFELQSKALANNPDHDIAYQNFFYTLDHKLDFQTIARADFRSDVPAVTAKTLLAANPPHNAPMWRRTLHDQLGPFDTGFKISGDWEFWLRCLRDGRKFLKIDEPHVAYYVNPDGLSTNANTRAYEEMRWIRYRYSLLLDL